MSRPINQAGLGLIKRFEGFRAHAYKPVPGERFFTIGYGDYGPHVKPTDVISEREAERRLRHRIDTEFAPGVERLLRTHVNDNRFAALVSLAYNIGLGAFASSTVLRQTNARRFRLAAAAFGMWVRGAGGVRLAGLVRRRAAEARLYLRNPSKR